MTLVDVIDTATDELSGVRAKPLHVDRAPMSPATRLLADVCAAFGVEPRDVHSRDRHKHTAQARHAFWWLARRFWAYSYPELGRLIGNNPKKPFDHTTVIAACRRVDSEINRGTPYGANVRRFIEPDPVPITSGARAYDECRGAPIDIDDSTGPMSSSASNEGSGQP